MQGRIFSIKKTTILRLSFIINLILYLTSVVLSFTVLSVDNLWFFSFCIFIGLQLLIKSVLFKHDSSCFFGIILLLIGIFYFYCVYFSILSYFIVFVLLSFSMASLLTYYFFKQPFQLAVSLSLFFAAIITFIFVLNIISFLISLALIGVDVLLLVYAYFMLL